MDDSVYLMWSIVFVHLRGWAAERSGGKPPPTRPIALRIKRLLGAQGARDRAD